AITIAADKEKLTPRQLINKYHAANKSALEGAGIAFDIYDRTSNPIHTATAQEFFASWLEQGLLVEREEDQFYDQFAGMFLPDRYVEGTCPNCGSDKARGDQCDSCGAYYDQLDLKNPCSLVSGTIPVVRKTRHWYFKLNAFQKWVETYIEAHAGDWKDNVLQQSRSWLQQGLAERAATRDMAWGIPLPVDGAAGKVIYVWFEAVLGYISATKQWAADQGRPDDWKRWWCDADTTYTAFLGKDNIVFHTIIFPILLHSRADEGYILPAHVPANEFLNLEGRKFSKSRNWAIDVQQYLDTFPLPQHVDILRYVLTMNMPETRDSDFTWNDYQARVNNELAAILGNYVNRVVQFAHKNFQGAVPALDAAAPAGDHERVLLDAVGTGLAAVADAYDRFRFREAATETMNIARAANKYFNDKAPWKTVGTNPADCALCINMCLQVVRTLGVAVSPIMPHAGATMQRMVGADVRTGAPGEATADAWTLAGMPVLSAGTPIAEPTILFTKIERAVIDNEIDKLGDDDDDDDDESSSNGAEPNTEGIITIEDFFMVKLRTAVVLEAENVPKSKRLLRLQVDVGGERRQIIAGIAESYTAEELVGTTIAIVANLQPATIMGYVSEGMVLAAPLTNGRVVLMRPEGDTGSGVIIR
ncbi:MAG: methionine--tRNA ligase, partial [Candidatus Kapabacteria bacterium]|nr:methionine--tRNA ligase [Candidatus Kapabacteria bacterium]